MKEAHMVDISDKDHVYREATAVGFIKLKPETIRKIVNDEIPKGNVRSVARTAGILAVKNTPQTIPLTHPIPITGTEIELNPKEEGVRAEVSVKSEGQTGVEMEALSGVSAALLTVWDMTKEFEKDENGQYPKTRIEDIRVSEKVKKE